MSRILSATDILDPKNLKKELVPIPELGGDVWVWELTSGERMKLQEKIGSDGKWTDDLIYLLVVMSTRDGDGPDANLILTAEQAAQLVGVGSRVVDRIFLRAQKLSGLTKEAADELLGNALGAQASGSYSASAAS